MKNILRFIINAPFWILWAIKETVRLTERDEREFVKLNEAIKERDMEKETVYTEKYVKRLREENIIYQKMLKAKTVKFKDDLECILAKTFDAFLEDINKETFTDPITFDADKEEYIKTNTTFPYENWQSSFTDWVGRCESIMKGEDPKETGDCGYCEFNKDSGGSYGCPACPMHKTCVDTVQAYRTATTPQDKLKYAFEMVKAIYEHGEDTFRLDGFIPKEYDVIKRFSACNKKVTTFLTTDPCPDCHNCGKKLECEKWEDEATLAGVACHNTKCGAYNINRFFYCDNYYYKSVERNRRSAYGLRRKWLFNCKQYKGGEK